MDEPVHDFAPEQFDWRPYVAPVKLEEATPEQREAMKITPSGRGVSPYVLTLALEPAQLAERSPLFNDIMYAPEGLSRGGREMGALAASVVNRCVYCAGVHAMRHVQLENRPEVIAEIFAHGAAADLPEADQALFDFGVDLTLHPDRLGLMEFNRLREQGLDDLEILDLIHAVAIFGWANRLMHTLGAPYRKAE